MLEEERINSFWKKPRVYPFRLRQKRKNSGPEGS